MRKFEMLRKFVPGPVVIDTDSASFIKTAFTSQSSNIVRIISFEYDSAFLLRMTAEERLRLSRDLQEIFAAAINKVICK